MHLRARAEHHNIVDTFPPIRRGLEPAATSQQAYFGSQRRTRLTREQGHLTLREAEEGLGRARPSHNYCGPPTGLPRESSREGTLSFRAPPSFNPKLGGKMAQ